MVIVERSLAVRATVLADCVADSTFEMVEETVCIASAAFCNPCPPGAEAVVCSPQPGQNFAPGERAVPHFGQNFIVIVLYSVRVFT